MTYTEKKTPPVWVNDVLTYHDLGNDGHPEKWVKGIVTGVSEEGFSVLWDDFKEKGWESEYEWEKVTIKGDQLIDGESRLMNMPSDLSNAIDLIIAELNKDKKEGSYYYGWQSNIAMAISDVNDLYKNNGRPLLTASNDEILNTFYNDCAKRFLDILCTPNSGINRMAVKS